MEIFDIEAISGMAARVRADDIPPETGCTYCGLLATAWDHYKRPFCYDNNRWQRRYGHDSAEVTPACRDCNTLLGAVWLPGIRARAGYVRARLLVKHAKLLNSPDWDEADYHELGPRLERVVRATQRKKSILRDRLKRLTLVGRAYTDPIVELRTLLQQIERKGIPEAKRIGELVDAALGQNTSLPAPSPLSATQSRGTCTHNRGRKGW